MAPSKKKAPRRISKPGWILSCFGFPQNPTPSEGKKKPGQKPGGQKRKVFRMCLPKFRVVNIRRMMMMKKKDEKKAAIKATQSLIMLEAQHLNRVHHKHALINPQDQLTVVNKLQIENVQLDSQIQPGQPDNISKIKQTNCTSTTSNVTKDSLIGLSIMLSTLIIMECCGKLCAVLCMSAWFYCLPLVSAANKINDTGRNKGNTSNIIPLLQENVAVMETSLKGS